MGFIQSKLRQYHVERRGWGWSGPPGDHSPYPMDARRYPGPALQYCFVDVIASYNIMRNKINLGPQAVTTNVEAFSEVINDCYKDGFLLAAFVKVPGLRTTVEIQDWAIRTPYQAIFSKELQPGASSEAEWTVKIEKKLLSTRVLSFDEVDAYNDLMATIHGYAARGARLACVTPVGYLRPHTLNTQYGVMGVELFFNVPLKPPSTRYVYHAVKVNSQYHVVPDATQTIQQIICDADFMGQMQLFLQQGWRLVDICMDTLALAEAFKMKGASRHVDTIWIFEKEASKLENYNPVYEGVIIEYLHKVQSGLDGETPCRDWRPVIAGMGVMGWQLAAMVQTPSLVQSSFTKYTMKILMLFQRPLFVDNQMHTWPHNGLNHRAGLSHHHHQQHHQRAFLSARSRSMPHNIGGDDRSLDQPIIANGHVSRGCYSAGTEPPPYWSLPRT